MDASKGFIYQFLSTANYTFYIPVYQREYSWDRPRCKTLIDDLERLRLNRVENNHFFGSIVYIEKYNHPFHDNWIIDGQQRLTTITLLLLAIYRSLLEKKKALETEKNSLLELQQNQEVLDKIDVLDILIAKVDETTKDMLSCFYKNPNAPERLHEAKIKLSDSDNPIFQDILFRNNCDETTNLGSNYSYFFSEMNKKTLEEIFDYYSAVQKLLI